MLDNVFFSEDVRLANLADRKDLIRIIRTSFQHDPCFRWITEKSRHRNKLEELSRYVVEETLSKGQAYISRDKNAAALWHSEQQEVFSYSYIKRNLRFLLTLGIETVKRSLNLLSATKNQIPQGKYMYLSCIGVLPEAQGKGFAKKLIMPVLNQAKMENIDVFLETANDMNVTIYQKMGFNLTKNVKIGGLSLYLMKLNHSH